MLLSVIIPAFNEESCIRQSIERIEFAFNEIKRDGVSCEIIVCDNNSTDRTAETASAMGAKVVFEPVNQISRARNTGAGAAQGEWLLFIDADSYPRAELIADVLDLIEDGRYIGCGATVLVEGGTLFNKLRMERLNPLFRLFNLCGGVFILCQREAFEAVQGFSADLYAYEEIDFVLRLKRYGRKRKKRFTVLHRHPVVTSGRKGEYGFIPLVTLVVSNIAATVVFVLYCVFPKRVTRMFGSTLLGYWYKSRR